MDEPFDLISHSLCRAFSAHAWRRRCASWSVECVPFRGRRRAAHARAKDGCARSSARHASQPGAGGHGCSVHRLGDRCGACRELGELVDGALRLQRVGLRPTGLDLETRTIAPADSLLRKLVVSTPRRRGVPSAQTLLLAPTPVRAGEVTKCASRWRAS